MTDNGRYARGLARAAGGAVVFALPLLMTMEMWWLGFTMDRWRLLLLLVALFPVLVLLSYHAGFEPTFSWYEDVADALAAYAIGIVTAALALWLLGIIGPSTDWIDGVGQVAVQAVPASIGALLARSILGTEHADADARPHRTYFGEIFIMAIGALFLAFSIAPTEEVVRIALGLSPARALVLAAASLAVMHAFVYAIEFQGQVARAEHSTVVGEFVRLTIVGYAVTLLVSGYVLWTFGQTDGFTVPNVARASIVLGFPGAIGAAAARLLL